MHFSPSFPGYVITKWLHCCNGYIVTLNATYSTINLFKSGTDIMCTLGTGTGIMCALKIIVRVSQDVRGETHKNVNKS